MSTSATLDEAERKRLKEVSEAMYRLGYKLTPITPSEVGVIEYHGRRQVAITHSTFVKVQDAFMEFLGASFGKKVMYEIGVNAGQDIARMFKRMAKSGTMTKLRVAFKSGFDLELLKKIKGNDAVDIIAKIFGYGRHNGWLGKFELVEFDANEGIVRARMQNVFIASYYKQKGIKTKEPVCHLIAGVCAGALKEIIGKDVEIREVKCEARGDEYCEFVSVKQNSS